MTFIFFRLPPKSTRAATRIISSDEENDEDWNLDFIDGFDKVENHTHESEDGCQPDGGSNMPEEQSCSLQFENEGSQNDPSYNPFKPKPKRRKQKSNYGRKSKDAKRKSNERYNSRIIGCNVSFF